MSERADIGAKVMFWGWMGVIVGGFAIMAVILVSGR